MTPLAAPFPAARFRRARKSPAIRALMQENDVSVKDFIWPVFLTEGENIEEPVPSMPGVIRYSVDRVVEAAKEAQDLGIPAICLFPYTPMEKRTKDCAEAWNPENLSNRATRAIKAACPDLAIMTDVALDPYNIDGHDGFVVDGVIQNDETVEALVKQTLSQAEAGADQQPDIDQPPDAERIARRLDRRLLDDHRELPRLKAVEAGNNKI